MTDPVRIGGFFSLFDTEAVLTQLRRAREVPLHRLEVQKARADARKAAVADLASKFNALRSRTNTLVNSLSVSQKSVDISGSGVTANATASALTGSFTVDVHQIATATRATGVPLSAGVDGNELLSQNTMAEKVTAGSFTINGVSIDVDPEVDTLNDVLARINNDIPDVTATLENDAHGRPNIVRLESGSDITLGSGADTSNFLKATKLLASPGTTVRESTDGISRLDRSAKIVDAAFLDGPQVTGDQSFTINGVTIDYNIENDSLNDVINRINGSGAGVRASYDSVTDSITLQHSQTGSIEISMQDDGDADFLEKTGLLNATQALGQNAEYSIDGGPTQYSDTNTVQVRSGVNVTFTAATPEGEPATVNVKQDTDGAVAAVKAFVDDFNAALSAVQSLTKADPSEDGESGILVGDSSIRQLGASIRGIITGVANNIPGNFDHMAQIGLTFGKVGSAVGTTNTLEFDEQKFREALESDPASVQAMFSARSVDATLEDGGTSSIEALSGTYSGSKPGTYEISDNGSGVLTVTFNPLDGSDPTTTFHSIEAGEDYTNIIPGMTVHIADTLQEGTSTITVEETSSSIVQQLRGFLDIQAGPGGALARRQDRYDAIIKDVQRRQEVMEDRIEREMDRLRDKFTAMEMAQARASSTLQSLEAMMQQLSQMRPGR